MNIIEAMTDPRLFGKCFEPSLLWGDTWRFWRVWLKALYGIALTTQKESRIYTKHTGRDAQDYQLEPYREAFNICGRKAGKTKIDSLVIRRCGFRRPRGGSEVWSHGGLPSHRDRHTAGIYFNWLL